MRMRTHVAHSLLDTPSLTVPVCVHHVSDCSDFEGEVWMCETERAVNTAARRCLTNESGSAVVNFEHI